MKELFEKLKMNKGKIVSSASCTELEISEARVSARFYVDEDGFGFVYFSEESTEKSIDERVKKLESKVDELSINHIVFGPPPADNDNDAELEYWLKTGNLL